MNINSLLTPNAVLGSSDFARINGGDEETVGHFVFRAKSIQTAEFQHLRAFNLTS